jgi:hypothetical protein
LKKLVSSSEAAKILGLSLQGVHYRIKKGQLESKKQDGKIFVYVDSSIKSTLPSNSSKNEQNQLIESKDDQIELLKKTIKFLKKQKDSEISRLVNQQNKIIDVFQSEVDLLKSAFNEMRTIYKVDTKKKQIPSNQDEKFEFMNVKDFFIFMKKYNKTDNQIKQIILEKVKHGDKRFIYKKETREVIIYKSDFFDLI